VLFGGRVQGGDPRHVAKVLHGFLARLFPGLASARITHAWSGGVAFAFDHLPHVGQRDGAHCVLACNGAGVVMMTHLGRQVARQIVEGPNGPPSAFARLPFPTALGYTGRPWFMPAVIEAYRLRDRLQGWP
jgi:glycine/D-amino acid oxidase-like deaminating enzyme